MNFIVAYPAKPNFAIIPYWPWIESRTARKQVVFISSISPTESAEINLLVISWFGYAHSISDLGANRARGRERAMSHPLLSFKPWLALAQSHRRSVASLLQHPRAMVANLRWPHIVGRCYTPQLLAIELLGHGLLRRVVRVHPSRRHSFASRPA